MGRTRKTPKPKLPTHERIERKADPHKVYPLLDSLVKTHRPDLVDAKIAIAWRYGWKRNKDGQLVLGKCKKAGDLDKQFHDQDFVIILNFESWTLHLSPTQRTALMHHELEHAAISEDQNGNPKKDARGRQMYRVRKHDMEEFRSIVKEYGCYKSDIEEFVRAAVDSPRPPQPVLPGMDSAAMANEIAKVAEEHFEGTGVKVEVVNVPTWRSMPIRDALDENFDISPKTITTLISLGVNTCGELADRLLANRTFGLKLIEVQPLCEAIEQISSDDPEPIKFNESVADETDPIPHPSANGHEPHLNGKPKHRTAPSAAKVTSRPKRKGKRAG